MSGSRELDALIAEKIMGWTEVTDRRHADGSWTGICHSGDNPYIDDIPFYSTDIAAAWAVVERFFPKSEWTQEQYEQRRRFWWCMEESTYSPLFAWAAEKAAMIICRAALKAVDVEV